MIVCMIVCLCLCVMDLVRQEHTHIQREHVDPHLEAALLNIRLAVVVQTPRLNVLRHLRPKTAGGQPKKGGK